MLLADWDCKDNCSVVTSIYVPLLLTLPTDSGPSKTAFIPGAL